MKLVCFRSSQKEVNMYTHIQTLCKYHRLRNRTGNNCATVIIPGVVQCDKIETAAYQFSRFDDFNQYTIVKCARV